MHGTLPLDGRHEWVRIRHLHGCIEADGGREAGQHRRPRRRHGRDDAEHAGGSRLLCLDDLQKVPPNQLIGLSVGSSLTLHARTLRTLRISGPTTAMLDKRAGNDYAAARFHSRPAFAAGCQVATQAAHNAAHMVYICYAHAWMGWMNQSRRSTGVFGTARHTLKRSTSPVDVSSMSVPTCTAGHAHQ